MKKKIKKTQEANKGFKLRGLENTRIESLSDGVFAIAIGLLLISTTPPKTFDELLYFTREFIPFAVTITLLMIVWYQHYIFFIRYGLRDTGTVALNTMLLFLVLFYVYPLKFMVSLLVDLYQGLITNDRVFLKELFQETIKAEDTPTLMAIYGLGAASVFLVLVLLNKRALKKKEELALSKIEIVHTRNTITTNLVAGAIPLISALIALFQVGGNKSFVISGFAYMLYSVFMPIASIRGKKRLEKVHEAE